MAPPLWGVLAGLTGLAGYLPYLRDAWRRASDPDPAAWLIWTVQYGILLASQVAQHPPWSALVLAGLQLAGTVLVCGALAARGGWRFSASRWLVLGCAVIVMSVWWFTRAPAPAMCLALAVEGAGMVLVMLNAYRHPGRETVLTWWIFIAAGLFDLPALWQHTPRMLYAYPVFFIVMGTGVLLATGLGGRSQLAALLRAAQLAAQRRAAQVAAQRWAAQVAAQRRRAALARPEASRPAVRGPADEPGCAYLAAPPVLDQAPAGPRLTGAHLAEVSALLSAAEVPAGVRVAEVTALLRAAGVLTGTRPARAAAPPPATRTEQRAALHRAALLRGSAQGQHYVTGNG
jgi:hypothetical protein